MAAETEIPEAKTVNVKQPGTGTWGFDANVQAGTGSDAGAVKMAYTSGKKSVTDIGCNVTQNDVVNLEFSWRTGIDFTQGNKGILSLTGENNESDFIFTIGSRGHKKTASERYIGWAAGTQYTGYNTTLGSAAVPNTGEIDKSSGYLDINLTIDYPNKKITGTVSQNGTGVGTIDYTAATDIPLLKKIYGVSLYGDVSLYLKDFRIYDDSPKSTYQADITVNENGAPCSNADVMISGDSIENTKAVYNNGVYSVKLPVGTYTYTAKLAGYEDQTGEITVDENGTVTAPEVSFSYPTASKVSVKQLSTGTWGFDANVQAGTGIDAGAIRTAFDNGKKSVMTIDHEFTQTDVVNLAFSVRTGINFNEGRKGVLSLTGDNNEGDFIFTIGARGHKNTSSERYIGYAAGTDYTEYSGSNIPKTGKINQTAEYLDVELTIDYPNKKITGSISQNDTEMGSVDYTSATEIPLLKKIYAASLYGMADLYLKDFIIYDGNYTGTYTPTGISVQANGGDAINNADVYVENDNTKKTKVQYNTSAQKYMVNLGSDLGEHTVTVSAGGYKSATATIQPGEENKTITLELMPKITGAVIQTADYTPSADTVLTEVVNGEDKGTIAYKDLPSETLTTIIIKVTNPKAGVNPTVTAAEVAYKATVSLDQNEGFYIYQFLGDIDLNNAVVSYEGAESVTITNGSVE